MDLPLRNLDVYRLDGGGVEWKLLLGMNWDIKTLASLDGIT